ncbi:MAG: P63C domain-containing protein, partial [Kiritimatiellae bacterium]|nr:P63C domain-containing protein [Kiritimatiellia bacterium]
MNTSEEIITKFGTQKTLATALGIRQSNVSYWAKVGHIPSQWHAKIIELARFRGVNLSAADFLETPQVILSPEIIKNQNNLNNNLRVLRPGMLDIGGIKIPVAVLSNRARVVFQREVVGLLTGNKKGGLSRYLQATNLRPYVPEKFRGRAIEDVVYVFPYNGKLAQGFEGTDLIELCDMYLKCRADGKLLDSQEPLALQSEIITRAFAKVGIIAAIDEATGFRKSAEEYQQLLTKYIAQELQPWVKTFGENFYYQIYRLKGWDWGRHVDDGKNHPWQAAVITNRIVYEKLPPGVPEKLRELSPKDGKGNRKHRLFQHLT